jgi:hypothetical protein
MVKTLIRMSTLKQATLEILYFVLYVIISVSHLPFSGSQQTVWRPKHQFHSIHSGRLFYSCMRTSFIDGKREIWQNEKWHWKATSCLELHARCSTHLITTVCKHQAYSSNSLVVNEGKCCKLTRCSIPGTYYTQSSNRNWSGRHN